MTRCDQALDRIVVTAAEQRRIDVAALQSGISPDALVESAGAAAADWIRRHTEAERIVVFSGPGGNGADALVAARHLLSAGASVRVFTVWGDSDPSDSVLAALERLRDAGGDAMRIADAELGLAEPSLAWADAAIDGLYGCGLHRPLGRTAAVVANLLNGADAQVISLDVPSGVSADGAEPNGAVVRADVTLAMEFLKPAHLLFPTAGFCGRVVTIAVAYPQETRASAAPWACVLSRESAGRRLPTRAPTGHKGVFGHVLLVAGSVGMVGAAILAGRAALRAGAGLLTIGTAASQTSAVHAALPEALVAPLTEHSGHIVLQAVQDLEASLRRADVLAIGPGLSRSAGVADAVAAIVRCFQGPIVMDADALLAISHDPVTLKDIRGRAILTPHPGELARLVGSEATEIDRSRVAAAREYAEQNGVIVVLKGRPTAVGLPSGRVYLNPTGNSGLATGGSGDVLTGIIAGLVAGGAALEDAALVGPYVHGLAAEIWSADRPERSLLPSDVVELLPRAFQEVEGCT